MNTSAINFLKGILIFLVVFGHFLEAARNIFLVNYIYNFIYTFHMPAFAFVSGYLAKGGKSVDFEKIIKKLVIPLVLFNALFEVNNYISNGSVSWYIKQGAPYWILWYLVSLVSWKLLSPIIMRFKYPMLVSLLIFISFQYINLDGYFLSVMRTVNFLPFYISGCCLFSYRQKYTFAFLHWKNKLLLFFMLVIVLMLASGKVNADFLYRALPLKIQSCDPFTFYIVSSIILLSVSFLSYVIINSRLNCSLFERFGGGSMGIYLVHGFLVKWVPADIYKNITFHTLIPMALIVSLVVCFLLSSSFANNLINSICNGIGKLCLPNHE